MRQEEAALHACLPAETELVVSDKNILVFKRILQSIGYRDLEAAEMLVAGAPVIGELGDSLEFPRRRTEPRTSLRDFLAGAKAAQASARAGTIASRDQELDEAVYTETRREVEATKLLKGPISERELEAKHGSLWVPARRFGLRQPTKIRPIDDFSEMGHNFTLGTDFKVDLGGVDEVFGIARLLERCLVEGGNVIFRDEEGEEYRVRVHEDWSAKRAGLVGVCADLEAAFRQVPRRAAHAPFTVISVFNPRSKESELHELVALAFGQGAAVYGFNRLSRALDAIFAEASVLCTQWCLQKASATTPWRRSRRSLGSRAGASRSQTRCGRSASS